MVRKAARKSGKEKSSKTRSKILLGGLILLILFTIIIILYPGCIDTLGQIGGIIGVCAFSSVFIWLIIIFLLYFVISYSIQTKVNSAQEKTK